MMLDEIYTLTKYGEFSYTEVTNMEIWKRRYFLTKLYNDTKQQQQAIENASKPKGNTKRR